MPSIFIAGFVYVLSAACRYTLCPVNDAVAADLPPTERAAAQGVESTYKGRDVEGVPGDEA